MRAVILLKCCFLLFVRVKHPPCATWRVLAENVGSFGGEGGVSFFGDVFLTSWVLVISRRFI